jgi:hypothetical protein
VTCKVLIVDDEVEDAAQNAARLAQINPALLGGALEIELCNTAYFVARRLRECEPAQPPWDVIIADIYMLLPSTARRPHEPQEEATRRSYAHGEKEWQLWEYDYSWNKYASGDKQYGGLRIAAEIEQLKAAGKDLGQLKLVLISRLMHGHNRRTLDELSRSWRGWFSYYDKTDWERQAANWPAHQNKPEVFKWALIQAIAERHSAYWGEAALERVPEADDYLLSARRSPALQEVLVEARKLAADRQVRSVLITGETGTGKRAVARLIHAERRAQVGGTGEFIVVDCSRADEPDFEARLFGSEGTPDEGEEGAVDKAAGGTLYLNGLSHPNPNLQSWLARLLRERKFNRADGADEASFAGELIICASRKLEEMRREGLVRQDLVFDEQLRIPPLREHQDDIILLAEQTIRKHPLHLHLAASAEAWLRAQGWPGNILQLTNVVARAARDCTSVQLTVEDLRSAESFYFSSREGTDERWQSGSERPLIEDGDRYVFRRLDPDRWHIIYKGREFRLRNSLGLRYIGELLRHPGREFSARELDAMINYQAGTSGAEYYGDMNEAQLGEYGLSGDEGIVQEDMDSEMRSQLEQRLNQLNDEIEIKRETGATPDEAAIEEKMWIEQRLNASRGRGGKIRSWGSMYDRICRRVRRNYDTALKNIGQQSEALRSHLVDAVKIKVGTYVYQPNTHHSWEV